MEQNDPRQPRPMTMGAARDVLIAAPLLGVAWLSRWLLDPALGDHLPYATFFIAVALTAWLASLWAALSVVLSGWLIADVLFVEPRGALLGGANDPSYVIGMLAYFAVSGVVLMIAQAMRHARRQSDVYGDLMRTTLSSIGDAVIATDADARVTTMNPVAERLTGWTIDEARGRPLKDVFRIVNEETRADVDNPVDTAIRLGAVVGLANHTILLSRDGNAFPIDDSAAPIHDSAGTLIGVVMVFHDITDRRQRERALQESEGLKAAILASALDSIISIDQDGNVIDCNATAEATFGYSRERFLGRPVADLIVPARLRQDHREGLKRYLSTGVAHILGQRVELPAIRADGSELLCEVSVTRTKTPGNPVFTAHVRDVGAQRRMEAELEDAQQRWRLALESADMGAWNIDVKTNALEGDERFRDIFHGSADPVSYEEAFACIHPEDRQRIRDSVAAAIDPDNPADYVEEYRVVHPDGSAHWVFAKGRANFECDADGKSRLASFDGTVADITERKQAEKKYGASGICVGD